MATDDLMGAAVKIRRGRHGGRTGKVIIFFQQKGLHSSYSVIKVQLDGSGEIVNINSADELEKLTNLPNGLAV